MNKYPLIVHLVCFNEATFIEPCICSIVKYVDQIHIIEGSWGTCTKTCGMKRSDDGTIKILQQLKKEFADKIQIHYLNKPTQLKQRSEYFEFDIPYPHFMWLIDGDEIYEEEEIKKVIAATKRRDYDCFHTRAKTFINDGYHYVNIDWPRLFRIDGPSYRFITPNHLIDSKGKQLSCCKDPIAEYYHYSCVHPAWRFKQKIRDRIATHGEFKWIVDKDGWTKRPGIESKIKVTDYIPEIVENHPLLIHKAPPEAFEYTEPEKIGFVIHSGMGNLILATPMLQALRRLKPEARISVLTWERGADVIHGWPIIDEVVTRDWGRFIQSIGGLDYLLVSPTSCIRDPGIFQQATKIIEPAKKPNGWVKHESEYNMELVRALGYKGETPKPCVYTTGECETMALHSITPYRPIAIMSVGFLREKPWDLKAPVLRNVIWPEVADHLVENGYEVIFMGCDVDRSDADSIIRGMKSEYHVENYCGDTSIKYACAIIQRASLFVGLDGGLAHVASCFDVPSVVVWTFTNPIKNMPLNKNLKFVSHPCDKRLKCQHGIYKNCPYEHKCRLITSEAIISKIENLL